MKSAVVSFYKNGSVVFGTDYAVDGYLVQSDLKEMAEDSLSRCNYDWDKCGIEDDCGILLIAFKENLEEIPRINPNEAYKDMLAGG